MLDYNLSNASISNDEMEEGEILDCDDANTNSHSTSHSPQFLDDNNGTNDKKYEQLHTSLPPPFRPLSPLLPSHPSSHHSDRAEQYTPPSPPKMSPVSPPRHVTQKRTKKRNRSRKRRNNTSDHDYTHNDHNNTVIPVVTRPDSPMLPLHLQHSPGKLKETPLVIPQNVSNMSYHWYVTPYEAKNYPYLLYHPVAIQSDQTQPNANPNPHSHSHSHHSRRDTNHTSSHPHPRRHESRHDSRPHSRRESRPESRHRRHDTHDRSSHQRHSHRGTPSYRSTFPRHHRDRSRSRSSNTHQKREFSTPSDAQPSPVKLESSFARQLSSEIPIIDTVMKHEIAHPQLHSLPPPLTTTADDTPVATEGAETNLEWMSINGPNGAPKAPFIRFQLKPPTTMTETIDSTAALLPPVFQTNVNPPIIDRPKAPTPLPLQLQPPLVQPPPPSMSPPQPTLESESETDTRIAALRAMALQTKVTPVLSPPLPPLVDNRSIGSDESSSLAALRAKALMSLKAPSSPPIQPPIMNLFSNPSLPLISSSTPPNNAVDNHVDIESDNTDDTHSNSDMSISSSPSPTPTPTLFSTIPTPPLSGTLHTTQQQQKQQQQLQHENTMNIDMEDEDEDAEPSRPVSPTTLVSFTQQEPGRPMEVEVEGNNEGNEEESYRGDDRSSDEEDDDDSSPLSSPTHRDLPMKPPPPSHYSSISDDIYRLQTIVRSMASKRMEMQELQMEGHKLQRNICGQVNDLKLGRFIKRVMTKIHPLLAVPDSLFNASPPPPSTTSSSLSRKRSLNQLRLTDSTNAANDNTNSNDNGVALNHSYRSVMPLLGLGINGINPHFHQTNTVAFYSRKRSSVLSSVRQSNKRRRLDPMIPFTLQ